jgi:DNA-directed RNA polymerase beta' subunit
MASKLGIDTVLLTDDLIVRYSADRVIRNKGNINLKKDRMIEPVAGGLYDSNYFGSIFMDKCNCGSVKKVNVYCHVCGSTPLDEVTRTSRFARIELPWMYLPYFKVKGFVKTISEMFIINFDFGELDEVSGRDKLIKGMELGQVEIIIDEKKEKPILRLHDQFTDISLASYEGLISEMHRVGMTAEAEEVKRYIDKMILVSPASMRGIKITTVGGQRQLSLPYTTSVYTSIMMSLDQFKEKSEYRNLQEEIILRGIFRAYLRKSLGELSEFTKSSKDNLARQMYSARVPNTSRSVITAGPELRTDEVSLPFQNVYAMMKKEFIEHIMKEQGIPFYRANEIYTRGDQSTLNDFEAYVKERNPVVIMVRQPAL